MSFLTHNPIAKAIVDALDELATSMCFAKDHRPEEKEKQAHAKAVLDKLRAEYPTTYAMTLRKLGRIPAQKATQS